MLLFVGRGFIYWLCDEKEIVFHISIESLSWNLYYHQLGEITAGGAADHGTSEYRSELHREKYLQRKPSLYCACKPVN